MAAPGCSPCRSDPPQRVVEQVRRLELLDLLEAHVSGAQELLARQAVLFEGGIELLDPAPHSPLRLEPGKCSGDFVAVDPVAAWIRAPAWGVGDPARSEEH